MTGTYIYNRLARTVARGVNGHVTRRLLVGAATIVGIGSLALAGRPGVCGAGDQMACALAMGAGSRQDASDVDRGRDRGKRSGNSSEKDGRRGRESAEGRSGPVAPHDFSLGFGKGQGEARSPRPHEWEETQVFMRQFAPRRQSALDQMPEGEPKESVKKFMFARFRGLQSLQRRDPAGYEQRLAQLRVEDQVFGIVSDWGKAAGETDHQQLREALRTQVAQLVDLDLQERQRRVEALKRELEDQTAQLERDEKQRDALIDKRVSRFAEWAGRWAVRRKHSEAEKQVATPEGRRPKEESPARNGGADKKDD